MRVPYSWLKEFLAFDNPPENIIERLTMAGLEVEGVESVGDDIVFEVNVTPNRPDCLSIIGIARELSAILDMPLTIPPHRIKGIQPVADYSVAIVNPELCNRYAGRVISGVRIADSPLWMKKRLEQCGIRSINNIVDITNYVLLEFGHPLHAFDADLLAGKAVRVGTPSSVGGQLDPMKMQTLDGLERVIPDDSLLIWDAEKPIAVAGIMGGLNTEVTASTTNIFLESAFFDPGSIRKTSRKLGLTSESSYRFERGTDIEFLEKALDRAALFMHEIAGGTVHAIIDEYPVRYSAEPIIVRQGKINAMLGAHIPQGDMIRILDRLGMRCESRGEKIVVYPSPHRRDITGECDVAEEIARIYGYDKILTTLPRSPLSSGRLSRRAHYVERVRDSMRKSGFTAVINYSFMNMLSLDALGIPGSDGRRKAVSISNPLSQDQCLMRTTLVPALIANLKYNLDRGMREIRLFEVARVFTVTGQPLPSEELRLGGIWYKEKYPSLWRDDASGFYLAKGAVESLCEELKVSRYEFIPSAEVFLHEGQAADLVVSGSRIGYLGALAPQILSELSLKKQRPEIILFELNLDLLLSCVPDSIVFSPLAKYPPVERDIAIIIDETIPSSRIVEIIRAFPTKLVDRVSIFDYFTGGPIPEGKKSLAFNIVYRDQDKTLTEEAVEAIHAELVKDILSQTGGQLRK